MYNVHYTLFHFAKCENERNVISSKKKGKKNDQKLNCIIKLRHNRSVCIKNDRIISTILKYQFQWWFSKKKFYTKLMISSMSRDSHISSDLLPFHRFTHSILLNTSVWRQIELVSHRKNSSHLSFLQAHIRWRFGHLAFNDLSSGCNNSNWNILIMSSLKKTPSLLIKINGVVNSATEFSEGKKHPNKRNKIDKNTRKSFSISLVIAYIRTWDLKNDHISQTTLVMKWSLTNAL